MHVRVLDDTNLTVLAIGHPRMAPVPLSGDVAFIHASLETPRNLARVLAWRLPKRACSPCCVFLFLLAGNLGPSCTGHACMAMALQVPAGAPPEGGWGLG